jgi:hypothetical protein
MEQGLQKLKLEGSKSICVLADFTPFLSVYCSIKRQKLVDLTDIIYRTGKKITQHMSLLSLQEPPQRLAVSQPTTQAPAHLKNLQLHMN